MWVRNTAIAAGLVAVATVGGIAAYASVSPAAFNSLRQTIRQTAMPAPAPATATATEPVRRASRIEGDMRATFERLKTSGERLETSGSPAVPATRADPSPASSAATSPPPAVPSPAKATPAAVQDRSAPPAAALAKPAKGMPVSLVPQRAAPADAPRVMDPRMTKALDLLAGTAPQSAPAPSDASTASETAPMVLRPSIASAPVAQKSESEMTADDLNALEHQRIRRALEGTAGGTN